jgi:ferredoxin-fold anticodon binding domain-containing protein
MDLVSRLRDYVGKEISLGIVRNSLLHGTIKEVLNDWVIISSYGSSKEYVKISSIEYFFSSSDPPEEKYQ